ncbi:helix-turn-helix transcriptional regulator [Thorsellia anophelis]|nr:WYL domain-containing protein [Thorsellia anophelis]
MTGKTTIIYPTLADVPQSTRNRLAFIDYLLHFYGEANRNDIISRFNIFPNQVTKDYIHYRNLAPKNIAYDKQRKVHVRTPTFSPFFEHHIPKLLSSIAQGFGDGVDNLVPSPIAVAELHSLSQPNEAIVAAVTRAIHKHSPLKIRFISLSSGETEREIVPHALVNNGLRWHVRAYDRKHQAFRDFVLTRIQSAEVVFEHLCQSLCLTEQPLPEQEQAISDSAWQTEITLEVVPHPSIKYPSAIRLDYGMENGARLITIKQALAPYLLRLWNVDCSAKGTLKGAEFHLWLRNSNAVSKEIEMGIVPNGLS